MKITKKQLKRIIREEKKRLMNEFELRLTNPERPPRRPARGTAPGNVQDLVDSLLMKLRDSAQQVAPDEIYIMTGEAEGVTVKVLQRGR